MAAADRTTLTTQANTNINDNVTGDVSPQDVREMCINIIDSHLNEQDVTDVTTDSDGAGKVLYRDSAGALKQIEFASLRDGVLGAAPVDGTTVAYYAGQLFWDNVNKDLYEATAASADPDAAGTGSTFAAIDLGAGVLSGGYAPAAGTVAGA